ncbi:MAG: hypothetical protein WB239_09020 [Acidimicrobiia bacterium]
MADQRRIGCGCLPLVALVVAGSLLVGGLDRAGTGWGRVVVSTALAGLAVAIVLGAVVQRRRQTSDRSDDGAPTATRPQSDRSGSVQARPPVARPRSDRPMREIRTGPRDLVTQADDPDTDKLRQHLVEAVADLADQTEGMAKGRRGMPPRLTSDEMIVRAKQRIAEMGRDWKRDIKS